MKDTYAMLDEMRLYLNAAEDVFNERFKTVTAEIPAYGMGGVRLGWAKGKLAVRRGAETRALDHMSIEDRVAACHGLTRIFSELLKVLAAQNADVEKALTLAKKFVVAHESKDETP